MYGKLAEKDKNFFKATHAFDPIGPLRNTKNKENIYENVIKF